MTGTERTTLGLKGGSTSLLSKACQLMVLKKECCRMFPTTPSLCVGSLSNNWQKEKLIKLNIEYPPL